MQSGAVEPWTQWGVLARATGPLSHAYVSALSRLNVCPGLAPFLKGSEFGRRKATGLRLLGRGCGGGGGVALRVLGLTENHCFELVLGPGDRPSGNCHIMPLVLNPFLQFSDACSSPLFQDLGLMGLCAGWCLLSQLGFILLACHTLFAVPHPGPPPPCPSWMPGIFWVCGKTNSLVTHYVHAPHVSANLVIPDQTSLILNSFIHTWG